MYRMEKQKLEREQKEMNGYIWIGAAAAARSQFLGKSNEENASLL